MRVCLPLDFPPGADVPLAALSEAGRRLAPGESLVVCPNSRTKRLFPLLEAWALDEGYEFAEWQTELQADSEIDSCLVGLPPRLLLIERTEAQFRLIHL